MTGGVGGASFVTIHRYWFQSQAPPAIVDHDAAGVGIHAETAALAIETRAEDRVGQARSGNLDRGIAEHDAVVAGAAVRNGFDARFAVQEGEGALAGMAQPPAVGDGPRRIRIG